MGLLAKFGWYGKFFTFTALLLISSSICFEATIYLAHSSIHYYYYLLYHDIKGQNTI